MSKNETTQGNPKDLFSVYQENVNKLFNGIKQSVPQYHQSITNVQQEYLQAYENAVDASISLQKEYAKKTGIASSIPEATLKVIHDTTEEFMKAASIQNQVALATIDATQQNIKTFNDNAKSFADLNKNIIQSWISAFTTKNNQWYFFYFLFSMISQLAIFLALAIPSSVIASLQSFRRVLWDTFAMSCPRSLPHSATACYILERPGDLLRQSA